MRRWQTYPGRRKGAKKLLVNWAKSKGMEYNEKRMRGVENPETLGFKLVLKKIKDALGLSRSTLNVSGAAPINPEILKYFYSLNIVVNEAYGMSECSGPHSIGVETKKNGFRLGSCGRTMDGAVTKVFNEDKDGHGEVCMGGRHVLMRYLGQREKTEKAVNEDGWLQSEDKGKVDEDGFLYITGRLKELLITAGGENVAPVAIEDGVKTNLPIVSQAVVLGDGLKFLSVLIMIKTEVDKETQEPLGMLVPAVKDWLEERGVSGCETVQDVIKELYEKICSEDSEVSCPPKRLFCSWWGTRSNP